MAIHNNKSKGNIGEAKCLAKLVELGIPVSLPFGDNERYDMVIEHNGKLEKIQVKYSSSITENGSYQFRACNSTYHTNDKSNHDYVGQIDAFLYYNAIKDEVYYVPIEILKCHTNFYLRDKNNPPKNNQKKNVYYTEDFLIENFF